MNAFLQLVRKDWRLNLVPLIALAISFAGPYIVLAGVDIWDILHAPYDPPDAPEILLVAAALGMFLSVGPAGALGANAFATERREHWADFLQMLPAGRWWNILSKLTVGVGCVLIVCLIDGAVVAWCSNRLSDRLLPTEIKLYLRFYSIMDIAVFGVAWALSTILDSAAISAASAIGFAVVVAVGVYIRHNITNFINNTTLEIMLLVAVPAALAATISYAKRVAP